jgi:hypothetical protein
MIQLSMMITLIKNSKYGILVSEGISLVVSVFGTYNGLLDIYILLNLTVTRLIPSETNSPLAEIFS